MATRHYDYLFKVLLAGDSGTGKTALLCRFADDHYNPVFISTIGIDFKIRTIERDGKVIKLQIWDTAGQDRFRSITNAYYRGANCIFLVFSQADHASFEHLDLWLKNVDDHAPDNVLRVLVGNKSDLPSSITQDEIIKRTDKGICYFNTSAKTGSGVNQLFDYVVAELLRRKEEWERSVPAPAPTATRVVLAPPSQDKKRSWC